jgi:hypothetical protein
MDKLEIKQGSFMQKYFALFISQALVSGKKKYLDTGIYNI